MAAKAAAAGWATGLTTEYPAAAVRLTLGLGTRAGEYAEIAAAGESARFAAVWGLPPGRRSAARVRDAGRRAELDAAVDILRRRGVLRTPGGSDAGGEDDR